VADPERTVDGFKPIRVPGLLAARWLGFNVVVIVISLAVAVWHLTLLKEKGTDFVALDASDGRLGVALIAGLVVYLLGAIIFIFWFHRAYGNLRYIRGRMSHGRGWAIGAWFVPILNLFRPWQIAIETWAGSDPDMRDWDTRAERIPRFIHAWWICWLLGSFGDRAYANMSVDTIAAERSATIVLIVTLAVQLAAGILAIRFVRRLTRRQEERAQRLRDQAA
jgi:hypothetical protein